MTEITVHNDYPRLVSEFAAAVILARAVFEADPDADNDAYNRSIDLGVEIYAGLVELHSSLELYVESLPDGALESYAANHRADDIAHRIMVWQRVIEKLKFVLSEYTGSGIEPCDAGPLIDLLRSLPQRP